MTYYPKHKFSEESLIKPTKDEDTLDPVLLGQHALIIGAEKLVPLDELKWFRGMRQVHCTWRNEVGDNVASSAPFEHFPNIHHWAEEGCKTIVDTYKTNKYSVVVIDAFCCWPSESSDTPPPSPPRPLSPEPVAVAVAPAVPARESFASIRHFFLSLANPMRKRRQSRSGDGGGKADGPGKTDSRQRPNVPEKPIVPEKPDGPELNFDAHRNIYGSMAIAPERLITTLFNAGALDLGARIVILAEGGNDPEPDSDHPGGVNQSFWASMAALKVVAKVLAEKLKNQNISVAVVQTKTPSTWNAKWIGFDECWHMPDPLPDPDGPGVGCRVVEVLKKMNAKNSGNFWVRCHCRSR